MEKTKAQKTKPILFIILAVAVIVNLIPYAFCFWQIWTIANGDTRPSQPLSDAASINNACKSYYADIVNGYYTIGTDGERGDPLFPELGEDKETRKRFALSQTVRDALEYMRIGECVNVLDDMVVDTDGNIYSKKDDANQHRDISSLTLTGETTLGELYGAYVRE